MAELSSALQDTSSTPPAEVVYAAFSLGVLPAQMLAETRPGAKGALLLHSAIPMSEFGAQWPGEFRCRFTRWKAIAESCHRTKT